MNVLRLRIRISPNRLNGILAVGLVDAQRPACAHSVGMKKNHDFTYYFLLRPCCLDLSPAGRTNPIDLLKPHRALFNASKDFFPKFVHQLLGVDRTDTFDQTTAKILFKSLARIRSAAGNRIGLEL